MYSTNLDDELEFNHLLNSLIKKNYQLFKNKISSGAYYRQVQQCKRKYDRLIYTILLFRMLNLMDSNTISIIESIVKQIDNISQQNLHHNTNITIPNDIIQVIDQIIKKTSKI